jgi:hypothetical protein
MARDWLGPNDILFCGHTLLYWLPFLKAVRLLNRRIVSLTYAREHLDFARVHSGIITLTPAAADHAKKLAPQVKVAHLGWGVDLPFFPKLQYNPAWFLSCGIANRDFRTLATAANRCGLPVRVICPGLPPGLDWPATVTLIDGGKGWLTDKTKTISVRDLINEHYPRSAGSLVIMKNDPTAYTANGFTNLIEALAVGQPVIVTRTGALPGELDVERAGCGLHVPPDDPDALADAMKTLASDPGRARAMGECGRSLAESHYNLQRYSRQLHEFFMSL